jgi:hypothetical protein
MAQTILVSARKSGTKYVCSIDNTVLTTMKGCLFVCQDGDVFRPITGLITVLYAKKRYSINVADGHYIKLSAKTTAGK